MSAPNDSHLRGSTIVLVVVVGCLEVLRHFSGFSRKNTVDALNIASREQRKPCKFPWFVVDLLAI